MTDPITLQQIVDAFARYRGKVPPDECRRMALADLGLSDREALVDELHRLFSEGVTNAPEPKP